MSVPERSRTVVSSGVSSPLIHPVLFAAYPVLFLWSQNLDDDVQPGAAVALVALDVAVALCATAIAFWRLRDLARSALVGTIVVLALTTFGRVARGAGVAPLSSRESVLLAGWVVLTAALVVLVSMWRRASRVSAILNLVAASLVVVNLVPILEHGSASDATVASTAWTIDPEELDADASGEVRDVYYLVFDRYAGESTLRDLYGFDNSPFMSDLRERGFVVVDDAIANYPQTTHSLASSLNMTYLNDLADRVGVDSSDWDPLRASLDDSTVARAFRSMGYLYVHVGSWWEPTSDDDTADRNYVYGSASEFSSTFLTTTIWPAVAGRLHVGASPDLFRQQWERVGFQEAALREVAADPRPTFTFAHFTLPHPPYVFSADGSYVVGDPADPEGAFVEQLRYTNLVIDRIIGDLLGRPGAAPIIVLQSDEGPHPPTLDDNRDLKVAWSAQSDTELGRKLRILQAYYLPGVDNPGRYGTITPVNSFRLLLSDYFGADLQALADRTYVFTDPEHPYRFTDVTDRIA